MAHSDYETRGAGSITPVATLLGGINPGAQFLTIRDFSANALAGPAVGMAAMLGSEIVKVISVEDNFIGIERGCADTIPQTHIDGTPVWFIDDAVGSDDREYVAGGTIGVKVLMRTSGAVMESRNAPPSALTFQQRFYRPYPPGAVLLNGDHFHTTGFALDSTTTQLVLTWTHRDRITQDDQLVGHDAGSIGPEMGTTYRVQVFNDEDTLLRTVDGIEGTSWTYTSTQASGDFGTGTAGYITLASVRDGLTSLQQYRINFAVDTSDLSGWGIKWGNKWGG